MSYMLVSLLLSAGYGLMGMFCFVVLTTQAENDFAIVWGSLAYWIGVAALALFTVGWPSAACSVAVGFGMLLLFGTLGNVTFSWGRALVRMGNMVPYLPTNWLCRRLGVTLKDLQVPLNSLFRL